MYGFIVTAKSLIFKKELLSRIKNKHVIIDNIKNTVNFLLFLTLTYFIGTKLYQTVIGIIMQRLNSIDKFNISELTKKIGYSPFRGNAS